MVNFLATRVPELAAGVAFYGSSPNVEDVPKIKAALDDPVRRNRRAHQRELAGVRDGAEGGQRPLRAPPLSRHAARLQQRHDAALRAPTRPSSRGSGRSRTSTSTCADSRDAPPLRDRRAARVFRRGRRSPSTVLGQAQAPAARYDVIIRHGTVLDGSGAPRYRADVAIAGGLDRASGRSGRRPRRGRDRRDRVVRGARLHQHPQPRDARRR